VAQLTRELWKGRRVPPLFSSFSFEALMAAKDAAPRSARLAHEGIRAEDWGA
jgi:glycerophosphoryl diester phosphodiesterase